MHNGDREELSPEQVMEQLSNGRQDFSNTWIDGSLDLSERVFEGDLSFQGATVTEDFSMIDTRVGGDLNLESASFNNLDLQCVKVSGDLTLHNATIYRILVLEVISIEGLVDLSIDYHEGVCTRIMVNRELAETVHWSAPQVPLIVTRA